jgi:DNA-directed RNA polymerase alpha subunit
MRIYADDMPESALAAIATAVDEEHSIFCLEQLGVPARLLNLLHQNGIRSMGDLMKKSPGDILGLPSVGKGQFGSIMKALSKYHTIEDV